MRIPGEFEAFRSAAGRARGALDRGRFLEAFAFGDNERAAAVLAALVLSGRKRATANLVWSFDATETTAVEAMMHSGSGPRGHDAEIPGLGSRLAIRRILCRVKSQGRSQ